MANSTRNPTLEASKEKLGSIGACSSALVNPWLEMQRQNLDAGCGAFAVRRGRLHLCRNGSLRIA